MSGIPFIGKIPGIGAPVTLHFDTRRMVEHPLGLCASKIASLLSGGSLPISLAVRGIEMEPGKLDETSESGWNYPDLYQIIAASGETVVSDNVVIVQANSPTWTPSGVAVSPGEKVWVDYRADGQWKTSAGHAPFDASGMDTSGQRGAPQKGNGFPLGCMLGRVDTNGQLFYLGKQVWNYPPPSAGPISLRINDFYYQDNSGCMTVRIIVAR